MKIILVSAQYIGSISGGGGVHVVELSRELGKLGYDVLVLSMGLGNNKKKETIILKDPYNPDKNKRKAKIKVIRFWSKDSHKINSCFEGTKEDEINRLTEFKEQVIEYLIKNYKNNDDVVVHIHGHFVVPSMAKELRENTKLKIVTSIHTFESLSEKAKGKDGAGPKFIKIMENMEEQAIKYSHYLIVRSKKVKEQITKLFPSTVRRAKVAIISSGVSSVFINHPRLSDRKLKDIMKRYNIKGELIFNLNRIDPSKGIEYLIKAYPKLYKYLIKKNGKDYKMSLVICGMIEEKNKWYYEKLSKLISEIKDENIKESISIHQNITEEDKIGLFNLARVFVLTSIIEPFGITIVEALAKDVPVIASGVEGPMDIMGVKKVREPYSVADGGIIVNYDKKSKRSNNLFEALKYVFEKPEVIEKRVKKGREKTLNKYGWEALVKEKINIYKKVLGEV